MTEEERWDDCAKELSDKEMNNDCNQVVSTVTSRIK